MVQGKNGANPIRICEYFNTETAKIIRQKTRFGLYSLPYVDGKFSGVLLAEMYTEPKKQSNKLQKLYVKFVDIIQKLFFKDSAGIYEKTTKEQLKNYLQSNKPDGEIIFLAADPDCKVKGIGTALLKALEEREKGKTVYLFTDNACTYQFYEHRGFYKAEETDIVLDTANGKVPLKCFIYSKTLFLADSHRSEPCRISFY